MTSNVFPIKEEKNSPQKDIGMAIATIDLIIAQLEDANLLEEAEVMEQAMRALWELSRRHYAEELITSMESNGKTITSDEKDFIYAACTSSADNVKKMLKIINRALKNDLAQ